MASIFNLCFFVSKLFVFGTNFAIEITFDVAVSTSEAMQFQAESLVIVKNRICGFNVRFKSTFLREKYYEKLFLTVCFDFSLWPVSARATSADMKLVCGRAGSAIKTESRVLKNRRGRRQLKPLWASRVGIQVLQTI